MPDSLLPVIKPKKKAKSLIPPAPPSEAEEELDPELAKILNDESMWQDLQKKAIEPSNKSLWAYFTATIGAVAWATGASRTSKQMTESTAQSEKWTAGPDYAKKWFQERGAQFVTQVSDTDRQHIRQLLKDNWGVGERQFAKNIAGDYLLSKERAMLIYRSEAHETHEAGAYANAFYNGGKFKVWISNGTNACEACHNMNGQVRPIEQPFDNGELFPHLHPNCGCYAAYLPQAPTQSELNSYNKMGEVSSTADFENLDKYVSVTVKDRPDVSRKGEVVEIQLGDEELQKRMAEYIRTGKVPPKVAKSPIFKELIPKADVKVEPVSLITKVDRQAPIDFTIAERTTLKDYTQEDYSTINKYLRGQLEGKPQEILDGAAKQVGHLDSAMKKGTLPEQTVYRALNHREWSENLDSLKGATIDDKAFISTSKSRKLAEGYAQGGTSRILMEISVPKGSTGIDILDSGAASSGLLREESEVLLARGSKFKVLETTHISVGMQDIAYIKAELVQ